MSDYQDPVFAVNPANSSELPVPFIDTVFQAINETKYILSGLSSNSQRDYIMGTAFGQDYNQDSTNQILTAWAQNNFTNTPHIELVFGQNFNGAYAKDNNTIYLSGEFLGANKDNIEAVTGVLVEEVGHYLDSQINVQDAAGDEGDIFSRLVRGQSISAGELVSLHGEDDHGVFVVDGLSVGIEKNANNDFNGDGVSDILWRNSNTGETHIWKINGSTMTRETSAVLGNVADSSGWKVAGTGDFNGDGVSDILWRNSNTGETHIWKINGSTMTRETSAVLGNVADSSGWKVAGTLTALSSIYCC